MQWIHEYSFFLFDLDGLLVNTEEIQYASYKKMCNDRGCDLPWTFEEYCQIAHSDAKALKEKICHEIPLLLAQAPWEVLYSEKKKALNELLATKKINLMPGVEKLLMELDRANIKRCVVTHSSLKEVELIRNKNPILNTIPNWLTREDYSNPKPHPDGYLTAISRYANEHDKIIGFEDSPRGMKALIQTNAVPVLISQFDYPEIPEFIKKGVKHFRSFESVAF